MDQDAHECLTVMRDVYPKMPIGPLFSPRVRAFWGVLYARVFHSQQSWTTSTKRWNNVALLPSSSSDFAKHSDHASIPSEIRASLIQGHKYQKQVRLKLRGHTYNIFLFKPVQDLSIGTYNKTSTFFDQALMKIYMWLHVIQKYADPRCSDTMVIYIYFTPYKKGLSSVAAEPLSEIHVNTAFTTSCIPSTSVIIFREEEWFKVFMHETFHNLGLDFSQFDQTDTNRTILDMYPIPSPPRGVRLYESYCEMWAEMFNALFVSFWRTRDKTNQESVLDKFEKMLKMETQFSVFQCVKILDYYGLTYQKLTDTGCEMSKKARLKYREISHILSYYIVKAALISQPNAFMEWCLANTRNGISFIKTPETIHDYTQLVKELYLNPILIHYVQDAEKWWKENRGKSRVCTNLRMTLYG
jgi:hypothetical protein